jgi:hypothetical protein
LYNVQTSTPYISGYEDSALSSSEFFHNSVSFFLRHSTVHKAYCEVCFSHLLGKPLNFLFLIAKNYCLSYC